MGKAHLLQAGNGGGSLRRVLLQPGSPFRVGSKAQLPSTSPVSWTTAATAVNPCFFSLLIGARRIPLISAFGFEVGSVKHSARPLARGLVILLSFRILPVLSSTFPRPIQRGRHLPAILPHLPRRSSVPSYLLSVTRRSFHSQSHVNFLHQAPANPVTTLT